MLPFLGVGFVESIAGWRTRDRSCMILRYQKQWNHIDFTALCKKTQEQNLTIPGYLQSRLHERAGVHDAQTALKSSCQPGKCCGTFVTIISGRKNNAIFS